MRRVVAWSGYGLILFGCLLILNQTMWPTKAAPQFDFLGMSVKTTFVGLAVIMAGAIILVTLAEKKSN